jgi:flagellar basal-body rod modification protein FlgD
MQINSLQPHATDGASSTTGTNPANSSGASTLTNPLADPNLFIALLTAQLKAQDPLNPLSPQDMVNQLTQVSSLQQLITINQTLKNMSTAPAGAAPSQTNPPGTTN